TQGAYATYVVHTIKAVFKIPDAMPFDVAALCDTASIALHSVKRPGINPGDVFVAVGSGGMGLLTAMCARALGAARCIVVGGGKRLERAKELGFDTVDYHDGDPVARVRDLTAGLGADVAVDSAGTKDSVRQSIGMVRKGGRVAFTGIPKEPSSIDFQKIVLEEIDLYGVRANRNTMEEVIPLMADGRIPAGKLITHHFKLADFREALRTFNERIDGALKVIVEPRSRLREWRVLSRGWGPRARAPWRLAAAHEARSVLSWAAAAAQGTRARAQPPSPCHPPFPASGVPPS